MGYSLYIHIPFCIHRCGYCDFNTYAGLQHLIPAYTQALCKELEFISESAPEKISIQTIYFGGGTPSLLSEKQVNLILSTIYDNFDFSHDVEITLEANPGTLDKDHIKNIHTLGINRISLGMQSANTSELLMLERQHTFYDVIKAVEMVRVAGFDNLNLDLIYGLPDQGVKDWKRSLDAALSLQPEHLSLYALTIEDGTSLKEKVANGVLSEPDIDMAADMYEVASEMLHCVGFSQYEISNWSKKKSESKPYSCRHNLQYWRNLPYIGAGAGAHGYIENHRTVNASKPMEYIQRMNNEIMTNDSLQFPSTPATIQCSSINRDTEIGETMMMGLRLVEEGVSSQVFFERFGITLEQKFSSQIDHLISNGLLEWVGSKRETLRLSTKGYLLGNQVFMEFI